MWKIMLVEDEALLRKALKKIITQNPDYEICYEAANGNAALDYLRDHKVDIMISDIRMPSMNGLKLVEEVYKMGYSLITIILSGYDDFEYARHMLKYEAFSYLLKPVVPEELLECLSHACEKIRQQESRKSILKSHTFQNFQKQGYAHFTSDIPGSLLNSTRLTVCCIDFEISPDKEKLVQWQFDLERSLYPCCCFWLDSYLYLVLDFASPNNDPEEALIEIQSYFEEQGLEICIGIGLSAPSIMDVSSSMAQAKAALHFYPQLPLGEVIYYERISNLESGSSSYPLASEKNLLKAVISPARLSIHSYIQEIQDHLTLQSTELIYQNLTELIFSCKHELSPYKITVDWESLYYAARARLPWQQILSQLEQTLDLFHMHLIENRSSALTPAMVKARQYIREHATKPLTLDEVAGYCYLSKSHFCKMFKAEMGSTFKAYLNQIRIELAKEYLETTTMKNYEIAEAIGFEDPSYFNELFKKKYGMTPTEYRNMPRE